MRGGARLGIALGRDIGEKNIRLRWCLDFDRDMASLEPLLYSNPVAANGMHGQEVFR